MDPKSQQKLEDVLGHYAIIVASPAHVGPGDMIIWNGTLVQVTGSRIVTGEGAYYAYTFDRDPHEGGCFGLPGNIILKLVPKT